jgi:hypothetical protein
MTKTKDLKNPKNWSLDQTKVSIPKKKPKQKVLFEIKNWTTLV